ncbi:10-formyltetrahydrofolate:L-methionyl-tRNA(fMet) N-formyltransferase [uncultured Alphaproteobacteria bacterium]|uniref:Methionyl-tRNA formyltransferase n=1 Tax=uncultured Alphaproteobacteria bacterium TaxID=91750 RepID=A0A212KKS7_9PROT|nr:10-formyltetrahydrofolate:L-methionyl-tRNA(fMet) N-formyltransferase [uncultured Alphaproteobacteria bacterium]
MSRLRVAFMGTPDFAAAALDAVAAVHDVACVYSQPPRPAGRGYKLVPSAVQARAEALGIPVRCPVSLKPAEAQAAFAALGLDVAVVAAYGLILPQPILDAPRLGCVNIHASLLPRWRGAAPIQRAIMAGDAETGITIMQMDAGLDTGDMLKVGRLPIGPETTAAALHDGLAALGARLAVETLADLAAGTAIRTPQPAEGVTYAHKIDKAEARIDWSLPAPEVSARIRGLSPFPGAWCELGGERVKVLNATVEPGDGAPGTALDDRLRVACGTGAVRLTLLQRAGAKPVDAKGFLNGRAVPAGTAFA